MNESTKRLLKRKTAAELVTKDLKDLLSTVRTDLADKVLERIIGWKRIPEGLAEVVEGLNQKTIAMNMFQSVDYDPLLDLNSEGKLLPVSVIRSLPKTITQDEVSITAAVHHLEMEKELKDKLYSFLPGIYEEDAWRIFYIADKLEKTLAPGRYMREVLRYSDEEYFIGRLFYGTRHMEDAVYIQRFLHDGVFDANEEEWYFQKFSDAITDLCLTRYNAHGSYRTALETEVTPEEAKLLMEAGFELEVKGRKSSSTRVAKNGTGLIDIDTKVAGYTRLAPNRRTIFDVLEPLTTRDREVISIVSPHVVLRHKSGRTYPAGVMHLASQASMSKYASEIWDGWFALVSAENPFMKDVYKVFSEWRELFRKGENGRDTERWRMFHLPVNTLIKCHSWTEYFSRYSGAAQLNVNFNKLSPFVSYWAVKTIGSIEKRSIPLLRSFLSCFDDCYRHDEVNEKGTEAVLRCYYVNRIPGISRSLLYDTVKMFIQAKRKMSLTMKSQTSIREAHDRISKEGFMLRTPELRIPKSSCFNSLKKQLPSDYEWIRTKKRLIAETVEQSHCVWSYGDKINRDECAIYSCLSKVTGDRHTIEFVKKDKRYIVVQIRKKFNKQADPDVVRTLCKILGPQSLESQLHLIREPAPLPDETVYLNAPQRMDPFGFDDAVAF